jgi:hypothetical protein
VNNEEVIGSKTCVAIFGAFEGYVANPTGPFVENVKKGHHAYMHAGKIF